MRLPGPTLALGLALGLSALLAPATAGAPAAPPSGEAPPGSAPEALELRLAEHPALRAETLAPLAAGLAGSDDGRREAAARELSALARARGLRLTRRGGPWTAEDARGLAELLLVDPGRFVSDPAFRARVTALLPRSLAPGTAPELRDRVLVDLNDGVGGLSFAESEAVEVAWGAAPRASASREMAVRPGGLTFPDDLADPIRASIYSLPSSLVDPESARRLLAAVHALDPERTLVALTDLPTTRSLAPAAAELGLTLVETYGRAYSPWPRDPFSAAIRPDGGLALVERPYRQRGREEDAFMARELVQGLPDALDRRWGEPRWGEAPIPFHNGHVLMAGGAAWVSLHSLELQILRDLGLERVPVQTFSTAAGIDRYLAGARRAMDEMAAFYGKPVRLVHPLPASGPVAERSELMGRIGGGAGFDLDSFVTLLPGEDGHLRALVGDLGTGRRLLEDLDADGWRTLRTAYGLEPEGKELSSRLLAYQAATRATRFQGFLDLVAEHLARSGLVVGRLPLLLVPVALLPDPADHPYADFVLGWNNVVVETRGGEPRAEGFASLLPAGDRAARQAFAAAGVHLDLLPPLVASVERNGGYRCASNQVRMPPRREAARAPRRSDAPRTSGRRPPGW